MVFLASPAPTSWRGYPARPAAQPALMLALAGPLVAPAPSSRVKMMSRELAPAPAAKKAELLSGIMVAREAGRVTQPSSAAS